MKRRLKKSGGYSLVEIIVTFALIGIFMASASVVLASFMEVHTMTEMVAQEQSVAVTVMETITGALSAAGHVEGGAFKDSTDVTTVPSDKVSDCQLFIEDTGNVADGANSTASVWYVDQASGRRVHMYVDGGYLKLNYCSTVNPADPSAADEPVAWGLGENVYNGCKILGLKIERLNSILKEDETSGVKIPGPPTNSLCVTIRLVHERGGETHTYDISRSLECYNLVVDLSNPDAEIEEIVT